jgi:hypothetical protein
MMTMDNVGMKIGLFGDFEFHGHSYIYFLTYNEVVPGWVQRQSYILEEPGMDFMVHDVNNP